MSADRQGNDPTPARVDPSDQRPSVPLSARIERTQLELRVAALEDALETSERRRQAVIDRYERLLEERAATDGTSVSAGTSVSDGRLPALVARLRDS
ncbi:hypothetical protein [Haloterrigena gelatinilytica]|uniref:hypothetical protein n=1 Tax=Haloterrigena gelatinilytica TaxID=2741724 RepID=UPI001C2E41BA|nr:hypothetical protein [Haloterrigena gelatinilytica]